MDNEHDNPADLDHLAIAQHTQTLLWHGLYYQNHPTPSGCVRFLLKASTTEGYETEEAAALAIEANFPKLARIQGPWLTEAEQK